MPKAKKRHKPLTAADFCGDGEPYSEVTVTISIRILGNGITRSRLAVNICPDPALEPLARNALKALGADKYGYNDEGVFGACLSEHFNAYEDMNKAYPRIAEGKDRYQKECAQAMNAYIKESVDWALALNKQGMEEAAANDREPSGKERVM